MLVRLFLLPLLLYGGQIFCQSKFMNAVKTVKPPIIDGSLNEESWKNAPEAINFVQNSPNFGLPASQKTVVKILYDDDAIYIGAYLYDNPALIRKQLTARDGESGTDVDYFSVFFDTYKDHQNGFQFLVSSVNVQSDARLSAAANIQHNEYGDKTWDAVWNSKVAMAEDGWIVEIRIPYISLRFSKNDIQDWGLQLQRFSRRDNESSFWNTVDPNLNGFINQFGVLKGLENIMPPLRLSLSPYISAGIRNYPVSTGPNKTDWLKSGGLDVKYGINESFTLDATLVPDFGQVISDNVVNNLTAFEIFFKENRQFFTEGTELFNKAGLFYSRRVGAEPAKYQQIQRLVRNNANLEIIKNPSTTTLFNATKFSGRTYKKLGIGIFNAVTAPMYAEVRNKLTKEVTRTETEPLANYNILVLDQAFKGRSNLSFTNTNVMRNGTNDDANVSSLDFALFNKKNMHTLSGYTRYSKIYGAKGYDGYSTRLLFGKVSGKIQYNIQNEIKSKNYDPSDLGFNLFSNSIDYSGSVSYNQFTPTQHFITYSYSLNAAYGRNFQPNLFRDMDVNFNAFWVFKNFWNLNYKVGALPVWTNDYFDLRTAGRVLKRPSYIYNNLSGSSDGRKKLFIQYDFRFAEGPMPDNPFHFISLAVRYRFSNKFSLSLRETKQNDRGQIGYAFLRETNGDPIVGIRNYTEHITLLTGQYNFQNRLNLSLRARHYWNQVLYKSFHNVKTDGTLVNRAFITGQNQNFNIFNVDAFLTWDLNLGSRLILGWKNWIGNDEFVDGNIHRSYLSNAAEIFKLRHANEFTMRFIYFIDYNQLRK